ncbi:MAG: methyltransferase domain-containing protein, partial [Acutalibacteraceae bacterium]|nr:methyltransferase domain-containing protein [Acutalibacteraceae bacterium]
MPYEAGFARIYDRIISRQIDFDGYCSFLLSLCADRGVNVRFALDIGCGSGIFTQQLVNRGIDTAAFDISEDMLSLARMKQEGGDILWLCQEGEELDLYGDIDCAICTLDSVNHILDFD